MNKIYEKSLWINLFFQEFEATEEHISDTCMYRMSGCCLRLKGGNAMMMLVYEFLGHGARLDFRPTSDLIRITSRLHPDNRNMNASLWHDHILERINSVESIIKCMSNIDGSLERSAALDEAADQLQEIQRKDLRQFKLEVRLAKDPNERHMLEKDLRRIQNHHHRVNGYLASMNAGERRRELFNGNGDGQALEQASLIQDETKSSISNIKRMVEESRNAGRSSLEELRRQRNVMERVNREADKGSEKRSRSQKLLKRFQRGNFFHKL